MTNTFYRVATCPPSGRMMLFSDDCIFSDKQAADEHAIECEAQPRRGWAFKFVVVECNEHGTPV